MFGLFKPKGKKQAIAFVDYEHWYISLDRLHKTRPNIKEWRDELAKKYDLREIIFFADFSNPALRLEIPRIREVSNFIIETQSVTTTHKKDYTDFIMLDHIYQMAISAPRTDAFIIFSGDGHFSSVTNYLKSKLNKEVGIYAIRGGISTQLKNTASWTELLPKNDDPKAEGIKLILNSLRALHENKEKKTYPTFRGTVDAVSRKNRMRKGEVADLLQSMISKEIITQGSVKLGGKNIKTISVDWKKAKILGYWE